jgi:HEAT repeat protein
MALEDEEWMIRLAAADALAAVGSQGAVKPLLPALEDTDDVVREAAYGALYEIGRRAGVRVKVPPSD